MNSASWAILEATGFDLVGDLYEELGIDGAVLDLMASWVSHFRRPPAHLTVLGMNAEELNISSKNVDEALKKSGTHP